MRDADRVERTLELAVPELQKASQGREIGSEVVFLPDIELEEVRMVRQTVVDLGRRQPIALQLQSEFSAHHANLPNWGFALKTGAARLPGASSGRAPSRSTSALMISSIETGDGVPGRCLSAGADSTAQASDAQKERISFFSYASRLS